MTSLFISYSRAERAVADEICRLLRAAGFEALFVDLDPDGGIPAGRAWERELYRQIRHCAAVVFLASATSVGSRWCFAELSLARSLGRPVFPIGIGAGVSLDLLADVQWVDEADIADGLPRLRAGLAAAGIDAATSVAWDPTRPPYPGLASFRPEDAAVFFGRAKETAELVDLLQPTLQRGSGRLVAIVGPSGSGKSSLLRAGLLPQLRRSPERWIVVPPIVPGRQPVRSLAAALSRAFTERGRDRPPERVETALRADGLGACARELAELGGQIDALPSVLVVVDQAEELLSVAGPTEQVAFLELLRTALDAEAQVWVVMTLRSEYLSSAPDRAGLAAAIDDPLVIEPLDRGRLGAVIRGPAIRAGLDFDPGLVERMVEDTAGGDALPLLAYTLRQLAEDVGADRRITARAYEELGGVVGALRGRADRLTDELGRRGQGAHVLPALLQLATVSGTEEPVRRRVALDSLSADERVVVEAFTDASLLVTDQVPASRGTATVEVAHEALLRQWPPLREAIEADRATLVLRGEIERLAADWHRSDSDESYLLRGERLTTFDRWATANEPRLSPLERRFLAASRESVDQALATARRSNRRLRLLVACLGAFLVLALLAGGIAAVQTRRAEAQAALVSAQQLDTRADALLGVRPDTAVLAALQGMSLARGQGGPPRSLVSGMARLTHRARTIEAGGPVVAVAFSPDGSLFASAGTDATIRLRETATGAIHGPPLVGHGNSVVSVAFSPNGKLLVSGGRDGTVRLWDVATGAARGDPLVVGGVAHVAFSRDGSTFAVTGDGGTIQLIDVGTARGRALPGHTGLNDLAFSPDGALLAAAGDDATVRLWNVADGTPHGVPLAGHADTVWTVAFSPDGRLLASGSNDRTAELWDVASGTPHGPLLVGHTGSVNRVVFSPDGRLLASASDDQSVRFWDVAAGLPRGGPLIGHVQGIGGLAFSPDGRTVASGSLDRTVRIWDVAETPSISRTMAGHTGGLYDVAWSPDGRLIATASADQTVRLWDAAAGTPHGPALSGNRNAVNRVAFSPDGALLASGGADGTVRLWDVASGTPHGPPLNGDSTAVFGIAFSPDGRWLVSGTTQGDLHRWEVATGEQQDRATGLGAISAVAFSPDGRLLASAGADQAVHLWDPATLDAVGPPLRGHTGLINKVAFSPDGTLLASASSDQTVRLWSAATGAQVATLTGDASYLWAVAFSPDGRTLAATSDDGTVRLWDTASRTPRDLVLVGHTAAVNGIMFSPDGTHLATSSQDQTARVWDLGFSDWVHAGCGLVQRNLSAAEWAQLAPASAYERTCPDLPAGPGAPADAPAARYG